MSKYVPLLHQGSPDIGGQLDKGWNVYTDSTTLGRDSVCSQYHRVCARHHLDSNIAHLIAALLDIIKSLWEHQS